MYSFIKSNTSTKAWIAECWCKAFDKILFLFCPFHKLSKIWWHFRISFRRGRSQSCPFCRDSLKRVNSGDLWVFTEKSDIIDLSTILREDRKRLFMYIDKLPLVDPEPVYIPYDSHVRWGLWQCFWALSNLNMYITTLVVTVNPFETFWTARHGFVCVLGTERLNVCIHGCSLSLVWSQSRA